MFKVNTKLHTAGDGYWSRTSTAVSVTGLGLAYTNEELDFGELRVYFDTQDWDVDRQGLIYTDSLFMQELRSMISQLGMDAADLSYSEQGMQGNNYVSCDVGERFINTFMQVA